MVPREVTAAPCSWATYATAMVSLWTSIPIKSVLDGDRVDRRVFWVDVATSCGTGFGKLTRVTSGVNLPPSEVIMSRQHEHPHGGSTWLQGRRFWRSASPALAAIGHLWR